MDSHIPTRRKALEDALHEFLSPFRDELDIREITDVLQEVSEDLSDDEPPRIVVTLADPIELALTYGSPRSLERDMSSFLDLRGICVPALLDLALLSPVVIEIGLEGISDVVRLEGRVVQQTVDGVALEIARTDELTRQRLRQLPHKSARDATDHSARQGSRTLHGPPLARSISNAANSDSLSPTTEMVLLQHEPIGRWQLEQVPLERVLLDVIAHGGWGVLQIEHPQLSRQLITHCGHIIDIQTSAQVVDEELGELLLRSRQVDERQIAQARDYAANHGTAMGEALVALQTLSYRKLLLAMKSRLAYVLEKIWNDPRGVARFFALDQPPQHYISPPLAIGPRILAHVMTRYQQKSEEEIASLCESRYGRNRIAACRPLPLDVDALGFDEQQQRLIEFLQTHPRPLKLVLKSDHGPLKSTMMLILALDHFNLLLVSDTQTREEGRRPADRERLEEIQHFYSRLGTDDHFAILGVHWSAYDQEIQGAYLRLTELYERQDTLVDRALRPKLTAIRARIQDAYDAICRPSRRALYRQSLIDNSTRRNALEMLRRQAETAKLQRDIDTAIDACCRIVELDPDDETARNDLKELRPIKLRNLLARNR